VKPGTKILYDLARHDLEASRALIEVGQHKVGDETIGFHLQQAVEKGMKALMSERGMDLEKIHFIDELFASAKKKAIIIPDEFDRLVDLNPFAVKTRYEVFLDQPFRRKRLLNLVEKFLNWVTNQIGPESRRD